MVTAKRYFKHVLDREKLTDRELALIWLQVLRDFCEVRPDEMQGSETAFIFRLVESAMKKMTNPDAKKMLSDKIGAYKASLKPSPTLQNPLLPSGEGLGEG